MTGQDAETPSSILEVASQPTARGGELHFSAGNIRLVNFARSLLNKQDRDQIVINPDPWMAQNLVEHANDPCIMWKKYMEYEFSMDGRSEEQLVIKDQVFYTCPNCGPDFNL